MTRRVAIGVLVFIIHCYCNIGAMPLAGVGEARLALGMRSGEQRGKRGDAPACCEWLNVLFGGLENVAVDNGRSGGVTEDIGHGARSEWREVRVKNKDANTDFTLDDVQLVATC